MKYPFLTPMLMFFAVASFLACTDLKDPTSPKTSATATGSYLQSRSTALPGIHPIEQRLYEYTSAYIMRIDTALAAEDDSITIARLNNVKSEMAAQTNALELELEPWLNALSEEERNAFRLRMMSQESISKIYQFLSDPKLGYRIGRNPQLRVALEKANEGAIQVWLPKGASDAAE